MLRSCVQWLINTNYFYATKFYICIDLERKYTALKKFSEDFRKLWKKIMLQKVPEGFSTALDNSRKFKKV
jgi:hypothetical protein